jgi:hypothetical protein
MPATRRDFLLARTPPSRITQDAVILIAYVMLKSDIFTKFTAVIGLVSGVLMMIPSTAGMIGLVFSLLSLIPWYVFSILAARQFFRFSRQSKP